ncbi:hypothetical protein FB446DRAFT_757070 [Lentinula raphanica]|nr:hypothetical protein FB446DRAFT_757070 [Lentinula raphanica]
MSGGNGLPVSDDIIDRFLLFSPTFSSLKAALLTCKQVYRVFQSHRNSVVRAVAYNVAGPALPQALAYIRHPDVQIHIPRSRTHTRKTPSQAHWSDFDSDEDSEDGSSSRTHRQARKTPRKPVSVRIDQLEDLASAPITPAESHKILANSKIVARLEDMFSFRYIDRTRSTSQLDSSESQAFCAAIYHLMLYSAITDLREWINDADFEHDVNVYVGDYADYIENGKKLLSILSTPELIRLHTVAEFLKEVLTWCVRAGGYSDDIRDLVLAAGPARILRCFDKQDYLMLEPLGEILDFFEEELGLMTGILSRPHTSVLESRNVKPPADIAHSVSISSRVSEKNSQCDRCQQSFGFGAHSRSTFTEISNGECYKLHITSQRNYGPQSIHRYLKNNLRHNSPEVVSFTNEAKNLGASLLLHVWNDLWEMELVRQQPLGQQPLPDWTEDSYLCDTCFTSFLVENLWLWWRYIKSDSEPLKENCWYGYDCRTQTHNRIHAQKLNHLCEQTRH